MRLNGEAYGRTAAGRWVDAATGEHGDCSTSSASDAILNNFGDVLDEARRLLNSERCGAAPTSLPRLPSKFLRSSPLLSA
ncbi:MAG: hypothetical protein CTY36_01260 [Methylocystis sp.]|nr:MAG: hypothetical protein CTY36_01260 [Methylocystis sp.]